MLTIPQSKIAIPRNALPQIKQEDVSNFLVFLKKNHVLITQETVLAGSIHPSQADFNHDKIYQMMSAPEKMDQRVIVSEDNILLDGHHRWLALLNTSRYSKINIYRVHLPFLGLLGITKNYPKAIYRDIMHEDKSLLDEQFEELLNEGVHDAGIFKAVFLAGGSGSGKDYVMKQTCEGHGLTEINSDKAFEYLLDKHKLDKKMPADEQAQRDKIRDRSKSITELKQRLAIQGRNGLIINGTGHEYDKIKRIKEMLEEMGYESQMLFVNTSNEVSRKRNVERGKRGGREIPEKVRQQRWESAQMAKTHYQNLFGKDAYHEFDNSEDLTGDSKSKGTPRDIMSRHTEKYNELMKIFKKIRAFTQTPPKHEVAQAWIQKEKGALNRNSPQNLDGKQPVHVVQNQPGGNQTPKKAAPVSQKPLPLQAANHDPQNKGVMQQAKEQGLEYYGFGRYGKKGKVTALSIDGKLVRKNPMYATPSPAPKAGAQAQLHEEDSHGTHQQNHKLDLRGIISKATSALSRTSTGSSINEDRSDLQGRTVYRGDDGQSDLRGTSCSESKEEVYEEKESHKESKELGLLKDEYEEDSAIDLGASPGDVNDKSDGGRATTVPKIWKTGILRKRKNNA